ncbi:polysaccharide biosynthesis C-terminal domain-containing protein [Porphyromonas canoris]|uniref:Membrane protein involved in the export of O-antigen and teichoic acid n=1 Tax=Porphyromonas canoris TaxID=36875 RepID=A0ABR4XPF3_9PORP|nr:oligosaccharide flippase family protein [Porphyromonas canoris]KGN93483.1 hypothetical protein HQ43_02305 [Porphyromonas canoris]
MSSLGMKSLVKDTVIYGMTNIIGRFLNWLLAPFYIRVLSTTAEYGMVTNLYAWISVILVVLTYGMETGLFRFMQTYPKQQVVYATAFKSVFGTTIFFTILSLIFVQDIAGVLGYASHTDFIAIFCVIAAMDAILSIPFAYLRQQHRPKLFAFYKLAFIAFNIFFNLFFFLACPYLLEHNPGLVDWFYRPEYGVGYIFVSNLLSTSLQTLLMLPILRPAIKGFDKILWKGMIHYCFPLMLLGLAGNFNKMAGPILLPYMIEDRDIAMTQLGIYGGCLKICVVMVMFIQAFRFAYDPFVFSKMKKKDEYGAYRVAMNFFVLFTSCIFLGVTFYIDVFKHIVTPQYYEGLRIVPLVLLGELFFGVYYNLSIWYKLSDKTYFGAIFSFIGLIVTVGIIVLFTPMYGYMACAWASLACNTLMMILSYLIGRKVYRIEYDIKKLLIIGLVCTAIYLIGFSFPGETNNIFVLSVRTILLLAYAAIGLTLEYKQVQKVL